MKKVYGYARVSTKEQHLDRQLKALLDFGIEERDIVTDKSSGMSMDREGYQMLKTRLLRDGDTLVIKSLDRLSRNKGYIKAELEYFKQRHIRVMVLDLPTTLVELPEGQEWVFEMINNILIEVLASIAEQERLTTRQRQEEGIAVAKEQGKHLGRPKAEFPSDWEETYKSWKQGELTAVAAMKHLGPIKSLDRLSRNKGYIKAELEYFKQRHIRVMVLDLPTTLVELPEGQEWVFEMINNILIEVLASIAEQERLTTRQRQEEGIAVAKEQGKHLGRPKAEFPSDWEETYKSWKQGELTAVAAMKHLGLKRSTFYNLVKLQEGRK